MARSLKRYTVAEIMTRAHVNDLTDLCFMASCTPGRSWWHDKDTGEKLSGDLPNGIKPRRNVPEMLCLIHSEISEAMEAYRKSLNDDKLPHRLGVEVELADALIRIFDMAGGLGLDLGGALVEKMAYNAVRQDHSAEARAGANGKSF